MSKHQRTAGADYRTITVAGAQYTLRPLTVGAYAAMEAFIASVKPDPLAIASEAVKRLPASQHDAVWRAAMREAITARTVTAEEAAVFENSVDGLAWKLWQCMKVDHPEINSLDAAKKFLLAAGEEYFEMIARSTELASGEAELKKSTGQVEASETTSAAPAGQSSIES